MGLKPTMQSIAEALDISRNSVQKALSGRSGVSDRVRTSVVQEARRQGYPVPTEYAHVSMPRVGVLIREEFFTEQTYFHRIFAGMEAEARRLGVNLHFSAVTPAEERGESAVAMIEANELEALLVIGKHRTEFIERISQDGRPVVLIDYFHRDLQLDCVVMDNRRGVDSLFSHLVELGHRDIGFIGNVEMFPSFGERFHTYRELMHRQALPINPEHVLALNETPYWDLAYLRDQLGTCAHVPTAWMCANDRTAMPLIKVLTEMGVRVPGDVSVVGFDDVYGSELTVPSLTTCRVPMEQMGARALQHVLWRAEHHDFPSERVLLDVELVVRDSTAASQEAKSWGE